MLIFILGEITCLLRDEIASADKCCNVDMDQTCNINIFSGEALTVKKSVFQGHVAIVRNVQDVKTFLCKLKEIRKVSQATHNIVAYRICSTTEGSYIQDCADDGEVHAGGRLLHLLQIMDAKNIAVVVSRWFGGILLGPDRFRLINNCARDAITSSGYFKIDAKKKVQKKK